VEERGSCANGLFTGAAGYIEGRLIPPLLAEGHAVRVLVRDPTRLKARPWEELAEIFKGDVSSGEAVTEAVFRAFSSLGGDTGWPVWDWAWRLRGIPDQLVGGLGSRRGRRHPTELYQGEAVDSRRILWPTGPAL
jgi:hypothetical protein